MEQNEEYHDPDYPGAKPKTEEKPPELTEEQKIEKIKSIVRREFSNELHFRENEVMLIEQRLMSSRRYLHRLRYALVSNYYQEQKLQLTKGQIEEDVAAQSDLRARAEVSTILRDSQRNIHPSVKKLLGVQQVDLKEIILDRPLRVKARKDYSAMVQKRNYTILADSTKTLRPERKAEAEAEAAAGSSKPRKVPRHLEPKIENVVSLHDPTRNKMKHRYRLIVGNTSKYAPASSAADRSTHQWLLYVRGPASNPDPSPVLTAVHATLHASYAPHHTVTVRKAPFHISRRGWGEFPAKIELHFPMEEVNRPATVNHTIKLDRNYTGLQTLGAETIVDVWLYSTPAMLPFAYNDPIPDPLPQPGIEPDTPQIKQETETQHIKEEVSDTYTDNWTEFFSKDTTELDVDEMIIKPKKKEEITDFCIKLEEKIKSEPPEIKSEIVDDIETDENNLVTKEVNQPSVKKRIMKYIDATTGKIYYLEMDRTLDLSKVQEIVINNSKAKISPIKSNGLKHVRKKKGVSLLKPEIQNLIKSEKSVASKNFAHIENDHCYLNSNWSIDSTDKLVLPEDVGVEEKLLYDGLCFAASSFFCVRTAVNYMLKKLPVITEAAKEIEYVKYFPFSVENEEKYWKMDFAKRRNIEWTRAKLINKILTRYFRNPNEVWRTKQILIYSRLHGYQPIRTETIHNQPKADDWSTWNDLDYSRKESNIKEIYPNPEDINSLTVFNSEEYLKDCNDSETLSDSDEIVDVISDKPVIKKEVLPDVCEDSLTVLPVESDEDRLRFMFIERKCADIGVELRNEDVGNGYSYSAVHAVLLSAVKSYAEELIRCSLAEKLSEDLPEDSLPETWIGSSGRWEVCGAHMFAARSRSRRLASGARARGTAKADAHAL